MALMANRPASVPLGCDCQVAPPSVVRRIVPPSPTAQALRRPMAATPKRSAVDGVRRAVQVRPASVVWRTVPCVPTAQPDRASENERPVSWSPWGRGLSQRQVMAGGGVLRATRTDPATAPADGDCRPGAARSASVANRHDVPPSPETRSMRPRYLPGPSGWLRPSTAVRAPVRPGLVHLGSALVAAREEQPVAADRVRACGRTRRSLRTHRRR